MTKNFAIVGDKKRCGEVIKTLEMNLNIQIA